jgi:catechol 2,3-dioxygenase-like lactoylglutathione lyase family enzyme
VERAVSAGATKTDEADEFCVDRAVLIHTPVGFRIELFEGMHTVEAPSETDGPVRFEHVNLATPNIDEWTTFLKDGIGLRVSDRAHDDEGNTVLTWMHCPVPGADHHGVAQTLAPVNRLHHIKWEYPDLEQIVERVDRFGDNGNCLVWGMGRHGVDRSIFAYIKDPGGLMNELGMGMLQVDNSPYWSEPRDMAVDAPQMANHWGTLIPQPWLEAGIPVSSQGGKPLTSGSALLSGAGPDVGSSRRP